MVKVGVYVFQTGFHRVQALEISPGGADLVVSDLKHRLFSHNSEPSLSPRLASPQIRWGSKVLTVGLLASGKSKLETEV